MKTLPTSKLIAQYEFVANEYARKFCNKQGFDTADYYWVGGDIGGIICFIDEFFFNYFDIVYDINSHQPKHKILDWQQYYVELSMKNPKAKSKTYFDYCKKKEK